MQLLCIDAFVVGDVGYLAFGHSIDYDDEMIS